MNSYRQLFLPLLALVILAAFAPFCNAALEVSNRSAQPVKIRIQTEARRALYVRKDPVIQEPYEELTVGAGKTEELPGVEYNGRICRIEIAAVEKNGVKKNHEKRP